jgi:hypothetical protein
MVGRWTVWRSKGDDDQWIYHHIYDRDQDIPMVDSLNEIPV